MLPRSHALAQVLLPTMVLLATLAGGCHSPKAPQSGLPAPDVATQAAVVAAPCYYVPGTPDLQCPAPPLTFPAQQYIGNLFAGQAWDAWAWSTFAALNWPALASADRHTYPTGYVRGVPDTARGFLTSQPQDVAVWETFKEKRELFNTTATAGAWQNLTFDPEYAPAFTGGKIEACSTTDMARVERMKHPRIFARLSKGPSAGGSSTVDETAEVASPPQESTNDLCAGFSSITKPTLDQCRSQFLPPNTGQYSTPYGASQDNPRGVPVGPRVFKGKPAQDSFIYYEVKLNYDYYAYLAANGLNDYKTATTKAAANQIFLPYRTTAPTGPSSNNSSSVLGYDANQTAICYAKGLNNCNLPKQTGISPAKLPGLGSIQLKAAWLPSQILDGNPADYHLTDAVYFKDSPSQPKGICYDVQEFGLIGLHIIQRVHAGNTKAESTGGTFIFATWEHQSIGNGSGYTYVNYSKFASTTETPYPNTAAGLPLARLKPYPLPSTQGINAKALAQLERSVWKNYRLIGTQFLPIPFGVNAEQYSANNGQPYYLANLVIESNRGLQQFQGQPPGQTPNSNFSKNGVKNNYQFFSPLAANMSYQSRALNMPGCMGCHGVAQTQGFSFSFVLQDGDKGTIPDTATSISIPPVAPPTQ